MDKTQLFQTFAKCSNTAQSQTRNCVIYTRVSSKEQSLNMSLGIQKRACEEYASKAGAQIMGYFGGTYESAKTDERKEFNKMLAFAKKSQHKVNQIIVYSVDRFSRTGDNAIYIAGQLKKAGIYVFAVTQPTDASTSSGTFQQNIQFIFSAYDNQLRREKTISGISEKLHRGEWCSPPPIGYDIVRREGVRKIVINEKGKLIKKAFYWKAKENITNEEVRKRLISAGIKMSASKVSWMLRNPFYCGLLVHNMLKGQVVKGNHEQMISEELFLEVNGLLAHNKQGYKIDPKNESTPLKRFIKCDQCSQYLRASEKRGNFYYQCNTKGCGCNKRADKLHQQFETILKAFTLEVNEDMTYLIREQMIATYNQQNEESTQIRAKLEQDLKEVSKKLERLEERFVMEEINGELYEKYTGKLKAERREVEQQLAGLGKKVSNIEKAIEMAITFSTKLATAWELSDYKGKQQLQFLLFPDGIYYNRKNSECRTERLNEVFSCIARQQRVLAGENIDDNSLTLQPSDSA